MELWEKKLRNAIRTEIRGLVNEGRLDLGAVAESLELDVSALIGEDAAKDWAEPSNPQGDGGQAEETPKTRGQASGPESATKVAEGEEAGDDEGLDEGAAEDWADGHSPRRDKSDATGRSAEDSHGRGQASGPESATRVAEGEADGGEPDIDGPGDASEGLDEDEIVAERWQRLAGLPPLRS